MRDFVRMKGPKPVSECVEAAYVVIVNENKGITG